ncbi:MAG TPA: DUF2231 domain-containing protein [Mycobacteriales bacterium]|nr:DUF2231 domain-containing protein [Mycobacteriales bacterium]
MGRRAMRHFSFRPTLAIRGRKFKGLRGYAGKPFHPPLTDVPVTAYLFAAVFDVVSIAVKGGHPELARQLFMAGTWTILGGAFVSVLAALTGWADWRTSSEPGTQARRTINSHAITMITVTLIVLADLALRGLVYNDRMAPPGGIVALSVIAAALVTIGATYGGTLVYDYGFNVETAGDSPVWHKSEIDHMPGEPPAVAATESG